MKKALIVLDLQEDIIFNRNNDINLLTNGDPQFVINDINSLIEKFKVNGDEVILIREKHEKNLPFFVNEKNPTAFSTNLAGETFWPEHCIEETMGSDFIQELKIGGLQIFTRGYNNTEHDHSGFLSVGDESQLWLYDYLVKKEITELYICGAIADFSIRETAIDAINSGFRSIVISDLVFYKDMDEDSLKEQMFLNHVEIETFKNLKNE